MSAMLRRESTLGGDPGELRAEAANLGRRFFAPAKRRDYRTAAYPHAVIVASQTMPRLTDPIP